MIYDIQCVVCAVFFLLNLSTYLSFFLLSVPTQGIKVIAYGPLQFLSLNNFNKLDVIVVVGGWTEVGVYGWLTTSSSRALRVLRALRSMK